MQSRWFFSQAYLDEDSGMYVPGCSAYGGSYMSVGTPQNTEDWALVQMTCDPHQIEAAKQDDRLFVLPAIWDSTPLDARVTEKYASMGATAGMTLAQLLSALSDTDPLFGHQL